MRMLNTRLHHGDDAAHRTDGAENVTDDPYGLNDRRIALVIAVTTGTGCFAHAVLPRHDVHTGCAA